MRCTWKKYHRRREVLWERLRTWRPFKNNTECVWCLDCAAYHLIVFNRAKIGPLH